MLKAIIIDDEPFAIEVIKNLAVDVPFIAIKNSFTKPLHALEYLSVNKIDLIFLDVKMPGLSGIEFLKSLTNPPMIIFSTAYQEHAVQSFELDAVDYLLKPFSFSRFVKACHKAAALHQLRLNSINNLPDHLPSIFIKSGYEQVKVELSALLYLESIGNYLNFFFVNKLVTTRMTMTEAESILPKGFFIRIHRSYIVSLSRISKVDKRSVWLQDKELPIGLSYMPDIEKLLLKKE
ncbi:DNA-binding LytR/AlgR family response regulator [Pedobacter sp. CAN_A7]|uniref:LytR/AlgR family response regulator transcription factor n=1 Tax=Pedobacter sp. CAN_A7 TaxID=2787722 RepID=UPI001A20E08F